MKKLALKLNIQETKVMASSPITSWQIHREKAETVADFIFLGYKTTVEGDCSLEIKRYLLLRGKAMRKENSLLKIRDITLPKKFCMIKAMVFPAVLYGCESWTINKVERQRTVAFKLWSWRRLLRVPWTARRSNQSILKEISPEYSLEGLMLKLKLQYFAHLMLRADSLYISGFMVVPYFLDYCGFVVYFEVGSLIPPALFFFLKIALAV